MQVDGLELDLHNDYDFHRVVYDVDARTAVLAWRLGSGDWVSKAFPRRIEVQMTGVHDFRVHQRDPAVAFTEAACLSSFGYDCDEDWAEGQFWVDGAPEPGWRWSFLFQSGMEIQVGGDRASATVSA